MELSPNECRVLGVLVEKAYTTPQQYPLTLNSTVAGCNQKSNRDPVTNLSEDDVQLALDQLRGKGLAREAHMSGSRVLKYRQTAKDGLGVTATELALLTELLLRGPQSVGELRGRATRIQTIESVDVAKNVLEGMAQAGERGYPLVKETPPPPGSRATRWVQLLCPNLHPLDAPAIPTAVGAQRPGQAGGNERIEALEAELKQVRNAVARLAAALGVDDPFDDR